MIEILDNYADSSVIELTQTSNLIEMYAEGVIEVIDKLEENEAIRSAYFTEATEEAENEAGKTANKGVISTIAESIANIFSKIAAVFSKGKVSVKGSVQEKNVKSLGEKVAECPAVPITLQNVWAYNTFVENTVDKYIRKFNKKDTMSLFSMKCGRGAAIDGLSANMRAIASQMRSPSNRKFEIKKTGASAKVARVGKAVRRTVGAGAAATGAAAAAGQVSVAATATGLAVGVGGKAATIGMSKAAAAGAAATLSKALAGVSVAVGASGPLVAGAAIAVAGGFTLAAIHALWSKCPEKIDMEHVTIQELYKRLTSLDAGRFPATLTSDTAKVNKYFQQADTLSAFANSADSGKKGAVRYAQKIADLMNAYAEFHQALIDFYLSVILNIIKEGAKMTGKKAYVPKDMVVSKNETKEESVEDTTPEGDVEVVEENTEGDAEKPEEPEENDSNEEESVQEESVKDDESTVDESAEFDADVDSDINDYAESVDDMEDYMNLDDFVAHELRDLNC